MRLALWWPGLLWAWSVGSSLIIRVSMVGLTQVGFTMALDVLVFGRSFSPLTLLGMALNRLGDGLAGAGAGSFGQGRG